MINRSTKCRELAAIIFTDMVGYSALAPRHEVCRGVAQVQPPRSSGLWAKEMRPAPDSIASSPGLLETAESRDFARGKGVPVHE